MRKLALYVLLFISAQSAFAHAFLDDAMPPVGSVITAAPKELRLAFTEPLDLAQCSINLQDKRGAQIALGTLAFAPSSDTLLIAPIQSSLSDGVYRVFWRVMSQDGHRTSGDYEFTLKALP